ncbi:unnamed protein product, partial [Medioppia subpectinata]
MDHSHHNAHHAHMAVETTTVGYDVGHEGHNVLAPESDHSGHDMMSHDMMKMYFHTNIGTDYVLFKGWKPANAGDMVWTCALIFLLAVIYEGLKYYREYLLKSWRITTY